MHGRSALLSISLLAWVPDSTLAGNLNFLLSQEGCGSDLVRPGPTGPTG